jgi:hypothetical protein
MEYIKTENGYDYYTEDENIIKKKRLFNKWTKIAYICSSLFGTSLVVAMLFMGVNISTILTGNDILAVWIVGGIAMGLATVSGLLGGFSISRLYVYQSYYSDYEQSEECAKRDEEIKLIESKKTAEQELERIDRVLEFCDLLGGKGDKSDNG